MEPVEIYPILIKRDGSGWTACCHVTGVKSWARTRKAAIAKVILANNKILTAMLVSGYIPPASSSIDYQWSWYFQRGVDIDIFDAILDAL